MAQQDSVIRPAQEGVAALEFIRPSGSNNTKYFADKKVIKPLRYTIFPKKPFLQNQISETMVNFCVSKKLITLK